MSDLNRWATNIACSLTLALAMVTAPGCGEANTFEPPPPPVVTVAKPTVEPVVSYREFPAKVHAVDTAEVRARVRGFLADIHYGPDPENPAPANGTALDASYVVKAKDKLFTIQQDEYNQMVLSATASLQRATSQRELTFATYERMKKAGELNAVSALEVIEAEKKWRAAIADVTVAEAALAQAKLDLSYTTVRSPIAGRANHSPITVGNLVGSGEATLLTTVVSLDPVYVWFNAPQALVVQGRILRQGDPEGRHAPQFDKVKLGLTNDVEYDQLGRIDYAENKLNATTGTLPVRATFPNPKWVLSPGMFVRVRIPQDLGDSILVPETCLQRDLAGTYAYVVGEGNKVERRNLKLGPLLEGRRVVLEGLAADDSIIVNGLQRARPGIVVNPQQAKQQDDSAKQSS